MISAAQLGWLGGLLEGEGCFSLVCPSGGAIKTLPRVDLYTTDKDIAERYATLLHRKVYGPYRPSKASKNTKTFAGKKQIWGVVVQGAEAAGVMMTVYTFLGERRREKVRSTLSAWRARGVTQANLALLRKKWGWSI